MFHRATWFGILALTLLGTGLGVGYNALSPRPLPWIAQPKKGVSLSTLTDVPPAEARTPDETGAAPLEVAESPPAAGTTPGTPPGTKAETKPVVETAEKPATAAEKPDTYPEIPASDSPIEIDLKQAMALYQRGGLLVLDARDPEEFAEGHIQGALLADYNTTISNDVNWYENTAKDPRVIMAYCGGGDCELSMDLAWELVRNGHRRVLVFMDGFPAWVEAKQPVQKELAP